MTPPKVPLPSLLVVVAIVLGLMGSWLAGIHGLGLGFPIFAALVAAAAVAIRRRSAQTVAPGVGLLAAGALLFAGLVAWRDAPELRFLNLYAVITLVGLIALRARRGQWLQINAVDVALKAIGAWFALVRQFVDLFLKDLKTAHEGRVALSSLATVARGLLIALPILLIFGGLLTSADARFSRSLSTIANWDGSTFTEALLFAVLWTVLAGGLIRRLWVSVDEPPVTRPDPPFVLAPHHHTPHPLSSQPVMGAAEANIALGLLAVLFTGFVAVQIPVLFGGTEHVLRTEGLSFAEYARRGFFELVAVVGLAIPILLGAFAATKGRSIAADRIMRGIAVGIGLVLLVIVASASHRMALYVDAYALTKLRIYVCAALVWLAMLVIWFVGTTITRRHDRFAVGALSAALLTLVGLNIVSPDRIIAGVNTTGPRLAHADGAYLSTLSADAYPVLAAAMDRLPAKAQEPVREALARHATRRVAWPGETIGGFLGERAAQRFRPQTAKATPGLTPS